MNDSRSRDAVILLVEDQPDDITLMGLALKSAGIHNPVISVWNGYEAVDYLSGKKKYTDRASYPLPALIFLDLKMPGLDGFGVLTWLREKHEYDSTAVVVLSSSNLDRDISRAKALGADDYLVKPTSHLDLVASLKAVCPRWLDEAKRIVRNSTPSLGWAT